MHTEKNINNHLFVIINEEKNELIPIEFFGMIVSSRLEKSKEKSKYKYNEPLDKNKRNGLKTDSIVKCDEVYSIPPDNILFKIGTIDVNDYLRFINSYSSYLKEKPVTA